MGDPHVITMGFMLTTRSSMDGVPPMTWETSIWVHPKAAQLGVVVGPAVSAFVAALLGKAWHGGIPAGVL